MHTIPNSTIRLAAAAGVRALTRSLAVEDFRGESNASRLLCDEGVVQLAEAAGRGQEQVPQSSSPGLGLDARGQEAGQTQEPTSSTMK